MPSAAWRVSRGITDASGDRAYPQEGPSRREQETPPEDSEYQPPYRPDGNDGAKNEISHDASSDDLNMAPPQAPAQEPSTEKHKFKIRKRLRIATLNMRGLVKLAKRGGRTLDEHQPSRYRLTTGDARRRRETGNTEKLSWHFSGGSDGGTIHHGVAIVIRNELRGYISDIETHSERSMAVTLKGIVPIHLLNIYAHSASTHSRAASFLRQTT